MDTLTGHTWQMMATHQGGNTHFNYYFDGCESLLLNLKPGGLEVTGEIQRVLRKDFKQVQDVSLGP